MAMLRTSINAVRPCLFRPQVASCSAAPFHSSAPSLESYRKRASRMQKKANIETRAKLAAEFEATKPHPALGHAQGNEALWLQSDLAKILLTEEQIAATPVAPIDAKAPLKLPEYTNFGVGEGEKKLLFEDLPTAAAQQRFLSGTGDGFVNPDFGEILSEEQSQRVQANILARVVDLRNANARGIAYENRRRCVEAFSEPGKPGDTGRPEVQAALLTMKIRNLWHHLGVHTHDIHNRRSLRTLIHQRAKVLKYLKRVDKSRYDTCLLRIGVDRRAVEGEITI